MELVVPEPRRAPRASRGRIGHFVDDVGYDGFAHFLDAYRAGLAELPEFSAQFDIPTSLGTVRAYRFDGSGTGTPVVLLPGRNASTPMWAANLPGVLASRTAYCIDLLGEAGLSVQSAPIRTAEDQAQWLDEAIAGLELDAVHLMGVSIGGWTVTNGAIRRPGRVASLTLLDPVMTFAPIPMRTMLVGGAMFSPGVPEAVRRRILRWMSGGADADESVPVANLIAAAAVDFVIRQPNPRRFSDDQLRGLDMPVLAFLAGRSVMLNATRAAERARKVLRDGQVELWAEASHAINGEFPDRIAERTQRFWGEVEG